MYKVVCIDLDGTLLDDKKVVSKKSIELLDRLVEKGINVIIATGRHYYMVVDFLKELNRDVLICANNGAMCRFKDSGDLFKVSYLDKNLVEKVVCVAREENLNSYVYVDSFVEDYHLIVEDSLPKVSHFEERIVDKHITERSIKHFSEVNFENINSTLCVAYLDKEENIFKLNDRFKYENSVVKNIYKVPDGRFVMEIQSLQSDKWLSVSEYLKKIGVEFSDVVAFGDEFNDINMVKEAGLGFAMKNGIDSLKDVSDRVTRYSNNEDGVYFELKELFSDILGD